MKIAYDPQPMPRNVAGLADVRTIKIACGQNHCVSVDADGKIWTWGNGGYGRLGHKVQKDEFSPRMVEIQGGDRNLCPADCVVAAGSTSSWVSALMGQLYCFGKVKTSGDNHMYPTPFLDLQGWNLRSIACGATTFVACGEDQAIAWGQGAASGLRGLGPKSSANPKLVDSLGGNRTASPPASVTRCSSSTRRTRLTCPCSSRGATRGGRRRRRHRRRQRRRREAQGAAPTKGPKKAPKKKN